MSRTNPNTAMSGDTTDRDASGRTDRTQSDSEPAEVTHAPPRLIQAVAGAAAGVGVATAAPFALLALPFGLGGLLVFAIALTVSTSIPWMTMGAGLIAVGALIAGAYGVVPPELLLLSIGSTVIAWDAGQHAIVLGEQLGREPDSRRLQLTRVAVTVLVVGLGSTAAYLAYLVGQGGRPASAVTVSLLGIFFAAWLLRR